MNKKERNKKIIKLKDKGNGLDNVTLGKKFNLSKERIRQIVGSFGHKKIPRKKFICKSCKNVLIFPENSNRKYCNIKCKSDDRCLIKGKPISEYSKEDRQAVYKKRNSIPSKVKARREHYLKNRDRILAKLRTPEGKKKQSEYHKKWRLKKLKNENT